MSKEPENALAGRLGEYAAGFAYPATPDIARRVAGRLAAAQTVNRPARRGWAAALALVILLAALLAIPPVRAQILEFIQVGVVRIWLGGADPTAAPTGSAAPLTQTAPAPTPGAAPTPTLAPSLTDLLGRAELSEAGALSGLPVRLPAYPPGLGEPDYVFVQEQDTPVLFLVWMDPHDPERARLSLHAFGPDSYALEKQNPQVLQHVTVNGLPAVWAQGPYVLRVRGEGVDFRTLVSERMLIWEEDGVTYRLESDLTAEEAVQVAESLETWQE
jgi:hypothetical protein